ncbi:NUDIX hydrolase [Streptomyces nodosus]
MTDSAVSEVPRQQAETRCSVTVFRGESVLLVRSEEEGRPVWKLPGGHVREDEGLRACAERELREETGIEAEGLRCALVLDVRDSDTGRFRVEIILFPMGEVRGEPRVCEDGREPVFVPLAELPNLRLKPQITVALSDIRRLHARDLGDDMPGTAIYAP